VKENTWVAACPADNRAIKTAVVRRMSLVFIFIAGEPKADRLGDVFRAGAERFSVRVIIAFL